jgi:signal transduction histidine kinase
MNTKEMADQVVDAVKGLVKRALDPVRESVGGLIQRADRHGQELEALKARVAALEQKQGKATSVQLIKAGHR